ncbi:MAG: hypothetical protein GX596_04025 [Propionibacterium sp.]|nr:hypothetical protein [Propionibacterium sp.]
MAWLWLVGALIVGGALLLAAVTVDARRRRDDERALSEVRQHDVAAVDAHVPAYVTQAQIDELPPPAGSTATPEGRRFPFGLAHPDLLPARGRVAHGATRVLVVDGEVTSMRQLIHLIDDEPLLVVADRVADEVGRTLAANVRRLGKPVLACAASPGDLLEVAEVVGAEILTADDLRAGYVPASAYGHAGSVTADRRHTWISQPTTPRP